MIFSQIKKHRSKVPATQISTNLTLSRFISQGQLSIDLFDQGTG